MKKSGTKRRVKNEGEGLSTNLIQSGNDNQATINHYHLTPMNEADKAQELALLREMTAVQQRLISLYQQQH